MLVSVTDVDTGQPAIEREMEADEAERRCGGRLAALIWWANRTRRAGVSTDRRCQMRLRNHFGPIALIAAVVLPFIVAACGRSGAGY